jgi:4-amino-4-deoxy-L-arabinose transferase-like glycosyltransferase
MFRHLNRRAGHYLLLLAVTAALYLPNLGAPSLWDIDEGNNAEAAREMLANNNWVVPKFNGELRVDKPALLYWLQMGAYQVFGVGEFAARLPSALAAMLAVLGTYELGRGLVGRGAGLLAGLILASTTAFAAAAHFANPDALLNACTVLSLLAFWHAFSRARPPWLVVAGMIMGVGVLAKGPVGLVLPGCVTVLFLLWCGRLRFLVNRWSLWGSLAFVLVMAPWYGWVGADTHGEFLKGFFLTHNVGRALSAMESHRGEFYYYGPVLVLGFLPWSIFLGPTAWYGLKALVRKRGGVPPHKPEALARGRRVPSLALRACVAPDLGRPLRRLAACYRAVVFPGDRETEAARFLWCWVAVYLLFFSLAATKLPNYILPLYAPLAILTGRFLHRWYTGTIRPAAWVLPASLTTLALVGVAVAAGVLTAGGVLPAPRGLGEPLPWLRPWAAVGLVPLAGAAAAWWSLRRDRRGGMIAAVAAAAVVFVGVLGAGAATALEPRKAPRPLTQALPERQLEQELRVGCYDYFQPSLVFYCRRKVDRFETAGDAVEFLRCPLPVYLFVPAPVWDRDVRPLVTGPYRLLGRHHDFYHKCDVVVVTNQ